MNSRQFFMLAISLGAWNVVPAGDASLGPYGPAMGERANVVRSIKLDTTGAIKAAFSGAKGDEITGLEGLCNPNTFANFSLTMPGGKDYDEVRVTLWSRRAIATGQTGIIKLKTIELDLRKTTATDFIQRSFRGPGTLTLSTHEAAKGKRRMVGTITGAGLAEWDVLQGKGDAASKIDLKLNFEMDASCGVKG